MRWCLANESKVATYIQQNALANRWQQCEQASKAEGYTQSNEASRQVRKETGMLKVDARCCMTYTLRMGHAEGCPFPCFV
eukprot:scaffold71872_cov14-Tisochrysis_lutea.AAC.2